MSDDNQENLHHPHVGAVFSNRAQAEAAVEHLRKSGLADEHLGVAVHTDNYAFEDDVEAGMAHRLEKGISIGAPIGAIAGMTVMALIAPGLGNVAVGGILAAGAATGALAGGFWGAYLGEKAEEQVMDEEEDWERVLLEQGHVLVVVDQHGHQDRVEEILRAHGGRLVAKPDHLD